MESIFVADKSLNELESLFACDIDDNDYYDIIAYNISQKAPNYLLEHVESYDGFRLRGAIFGLGCRKVRDDQLSGLLTSFLDHPDPLIIAEAIDALINSENKDMWERINRFANHGSPYVRGAVLRYARGSLPQNQSYPLLISGLKDPDPIVVQNAVDELGELGNKEARGHLRPLLKADSPEVRQAAKSALTALR